MASKSRTKNSFLNLIFGLGGHILTVVVDFIVRTVFIYTMGKSYLGITGLFTNILSMLSLANLGIGTAIVYRMYKPLAERDEKRVRVLLKFYKLAYRLIGTVIFLLGLALVPFLPYLIKDYDALAGIGIHAPAFFMLFVLHSATSYWFLAYRTSVISANQERYILEAVGYCSHILVCIAKILVLLFVKDFMVYVAVPMGIGILFNLIKGVLAKKRYPQYFTREEASLTKGEIVDMLKDCGALLVFKINGVVVKASDNLILSSMIGLATVGLYSNYMLFYRTFTSLFGQVLTSYKASLGNLYATSDIEKRYRYFNITSFLVSAVFGVAAVGVAVCSNELIEVWIGADYVIAQPMPILIGIELYLVGILDNLGQVRHVSGLFKQMWYRPLFSMTINIVVSIIGAKYWGVCGVTVGTIVAWSSTNFLMDPRLIYKHAFENCRPVRDYYVRAFSHIGVLIAVAAADFAFCSHVLTGRGLLSLAFHIIVTGLSVPAAFALVFRKTDECRYLMDMARGMIGKAMARLR